MSGAPFRELFVELSRDAFEIAKGIGEQAVHRARERLKQTTPRRQGRVSQIVDAFSSEGPANRYLLSRYRWTRLSIRRAASFDGIEFTVLLPCGHTHQVRPIDELILHRSLMGEIVNTLIEILDKRDDEAPRSCFCTPRER